MKVCNTCGAEKPLSEYHRRSDTGKPRSDCKICINKKNLLRYKTNEDTKASHIKAAHAFNVKRYGLTLGEYDDMYSQQKGRCKICDVEVFKPTERKGLMLSACIDHCHETGVVRGLLCRQCNTGIGSFKESLVNLKSAVSYLEAFFEKDSCN